MTVTLNYLREQTKETYKITREQDTLSWPHRFRGLNMRQAWEKNRELIEPFLESSDLMKFPAHMINFHRAGEIYYHAKEHGLKSAMFLKLQRQ